MLRLFLVVPLLAAVGLVPTPAADPLPVAPPPRPVLDAGLDPALAAWTPRPATGPAEPWEKATDKDWVDPRFRLMDTGPFLNCTMDYSLGKGKQRVFKATAIKLADPSSGGREPTVAGVVFDRCTMRLAAGWAGGWLNHSDRRFGLLNTPTPKGEVAFGLPAGAGWADSDGDWDTRALRFTAPLPRWWVKYRGLYLHGGRTVIRYTVGETEVLESASVERADGFTALTRTIEVGKTAAEHWAELLRAPSIGGGDSGMVTPVRKVAYHTTALRDGQRLAFAVLRTGARTGLWSEGGRHGALFRPSETAGRVKLIVARIPEDGLKEFAALVDAAALPEDLSVLIKGGPRRWGEPIVTQLERGRADGPFAVDTLTVPYQNRFNALFFCTGLDFLPDGRIAVCTCHGDVWLVTVDEQAATCSWQRFATGLYHPLGLKVVDGKVVVLERGQLTRLHDLNADGEADFYECLCDDWHTGGGEHSYDTCLETDPDGNFYFFKTGDTDTPTGGCLMKVAKDGSKAEMFATGFRHPIGMGMSPSGVLTGADQEGNWMPATRIDEYKKGGFYGDMRAHHRPTRPAIYDGPLCWVPREVDNSAGGQVWVPEGRFGPLGGLPLHLSYGRCRAFVLLRQVCDNGVSQGGVADLGLAFLSGACRGRFGPDGHLYVCGLNGWQTAAKADGCLQRVRYTGNPPDVPVGLAVEGDTVRLTFSRPLDADAAADPDRFRAAWWDYRWSGDYGSKRWKVSDPTKEGQDDVPVRGAELLGDRRTVVLKFDELRPVMQMQVGYNLLAADGKKVVGSVFLTIHTTGK